MESLAADDTFNQSLILELDGHDHRIHDDEHAYRDFLRGVCAVGPLGQCLRPRWAEARRNRFQGGSRSRASVRRRPLR